MSFRPAQERASWREWLAERDPDGSAVIESFLSGAHAAGPLTERERHIVLFVAALSRQVRASVVAHGRSALGAGASVEELQHAVLLTTLSAGLPSAVLGVAVLQDLVQDTRAEPGNLQAQ
jgi:4-carboxymuconolactone decarboxylase